jgi:hypothetical protein
MLAMSTDAQPDRLLKIVALTMALGRRHLAVFGSYKSRKDFTQQQLMACLILRTYLKTTYRGVIEFLAVSAELREAIGLKKLPNYSTLKKFADRPGVMDAMHGMLATLAEAVASANPEVYLDAAMDATGLETSGASAHFVSRSGKTRKRFIKVSVLILCSSLVPASMVLGWGPGNDKAQAGVLIDRAASAVRPDLLYADAGHDAEWVHERCVDWGVMSVIKPVKHRKDGSLGGLYRSQMTEMNLKKLGYGRRWLAETFMSGMKRTMGSTLNATSERGLMTDAAMKVLAYAIRR